MSMYRLSMSNKIIRISDNSIIPEDLGNADYREYLMWKTQGNDPEPYIAPPPTKDELDTVAAKSYQKLSNMCAMSPAEIQAWVTANIKTLADAKDTIITLAIGMSVLGRRM